MADVAARPPGHGKGMAANRQAVPTLTLHTGSAARVLPGLPAGSVDLVLTSPPFLGLRSYLARPDPDELGIEDSPGEYLDHLLDVVEACRQVLAPHGSLVIEVGDNYAGSGTGVAAHEQTGRRRTRAVTRDLKRRRDRVADAGILQGGKSWAGTKDGWPGAKSRCAIPELLTVALAYGVNPLTGRKASTWLVRNSIPWCRRQVMPGKPTDRLRSYHSTILVACTSTTRWWDASHLDIDHSRDWWVQENHGLPRAARSQGVEHSAVFPEALVSPLVEAMCPEHVCLGCGVPAAPGEEAGTCACGLARWRPGVVLDPFAGSGTVLSVAHDLGRSAIGIDIDPAAEGRIRARLGLFGQLMASGE